MNDSTRVWRYQVYRCKGGFLLNLYWQGGKSESEIYTKKMHLVTRFADLIGALEEDDDPEIIIEEATCEKAS